MHIIYGTHLCKFSSKPSQDVIDAVREMMFYVPEAAKKQAQLQRWKNKKNGGKGPIFDPQKCLYDGRSFTFPTGLLAWVRNKLPDIEVVGLPELVEPEDAQALYFGFTPRVGQLEATLALLASPRSAAVLPCGYGKSKTVAMLAKCLPTSKILVTVPATRLLHQNREALSKVLGEVVGILGDSETELTPRVVVATIQSLSRRVDEADPAVHAWLPTVDVWISDEAHGSSAESYRGPSRLMTSAHRRWGLTATWGREDGCGLVLEAVLGSKVYERTCEEAIADGALAPPIIVFKRAPRQKNPGSPRNFASFYKHNIVENRMRNLQVLLDAAELVDAGLTPALVMVRIKDHGKALAKLLGAPFVDGDKSSKKTDQILTEFLRGDFPVLVASSVLNVGVDTDKLVSAVNAASGDSELMAMQKLGRGQRAVPGKTLFVYRDYEDTEPKVLSGHSHTRKIVYQKNFPGRVKRASLESVTDLIPG